MVDKKAKEEKVIEEPRIIEITTLEDACNLFDEHYELDGKLQKEVVTVLKNWIESKWITAKKDMSAAGMSMIELDWLVWIYGKIRYVTKEENEEIIGQYKNIVDIYDYRNRKITEEKHFTTMFQVITYDLEAEPCMEK